MEAFKQHAAAIKTRQLMSEYGLGEKVVRRLLDFHGLKWIPLAKGGYDTSGPTKIERAVKDFLDQNGIFYEEQYNIGRYFVDFKVGRLAIEVQGDFWHCNPKIYSRSGTETQKKNIINDTMKRNLLEQASFKVIYIWENDLKKRPSETLQGLLAEIRRN